MANQITDDEETPTLLPPAERHGPYRFAEVGPGVVEIENTSGTRFKVMITALEAYVAARVRAEVRRQLDNAPARDVLTGRWKP